MQKILLVEDEAALGEIIKNYLSSQDFEVEWVSDLASIKKLVSVFRPDLVLLDHNLPDGSGIEALPRLRQVFPKAKFVIFSNQNKLDLERVALSAGAVAFWSKTSVTITNLVPKIRELLDG